MIFKTSELDGRANYHLLSGGITPRPIAWISTRSKEGVDNLAPFSFFTVASCDPPVLLYTEVKQRNGLNKDTLNNLLATKECVVNIVSVPLLEKMNKTSAACPPNESEFQFANIESCPSHVVQPLSVKESPIRYECVLREVLTISDLPTGGSVVLLDVKAVYVQGDLYADGKIDQKLHNTVGRNGGSSYSISPEKVELTRPS